MKKITKKFLIFINFLLLNCWIWLKIPLEHVHELARQIDLLLNVQTSNQGSGFKKLEVNECFKIKDLKGFLDYTSWWGWTSAQVFMKIYYVKKAMHGQSYV